VSDWFEERPINKTSRQQIASVLGDKVSFVGIDWTKFPDGTKTGKTVRMLDYACGTGFLSRVCRAPCDTTVLLLTADQVFGPYVSSINAIDASSAMVERYNKNIDTFGLGREKVAVMVGNLLSDPPQPSSLDRDEYSRFDLITVGAALHHFPSAEDAVRLLGQRLKPGGVLFIQDLYSYVASEVVQEAGKAKHPQQKESDMAQMMGKAGLVDFEYEVLQGNFEIELPSEEVGQIRCFIARAARPLS
jgi:SAM-dependent methyltransferase